MVHDPLADEGPLHALLVDPGEASGKFLARTLDRFGLRIHRAYDGTSALRMAGEIRFDVVLTTYVLPDDDGISLAAKLRPWLKEAAPVVMVTSENDQALLERAFRNGVTDVFTRDDLAQLENFLNYFLAHRTDMLAGASLLLVEDSPLQQRSLQVILERRRYRVETVGSVAAARAAMTQNEYELFVIDLVLADGESGLSLIRQLRRRPEDFVLNPIIVLTGFHDTARKNELYRLGVNDYVVKPPHDVELLARVHNLVLMRRLYLQARERERLLQVMAVTDKLTGIPNRHAYEDVARRYFERAKRDGKPLTLLVVDIDRFKRINDTFGHAYGDKILIEVAQRIAKSVRASDFLARFGGEEFVVLLPNCDLAHAAKKAERIRRDIEQHVRDKTGESVTVSIGVAELAPQKETFDEGFARADAALYAAKVQGRNRVAVAAPATH